MICTTALLDGGPSDGDRVDTAATTELDAPEIVVTHQGQKHRYVAATGPIADRWRQSGVALYGWAGPL
ncbi:MAG: hypothetical protein V4737_16910 [Curtobacterium sp.]